MKNENDSNENKNTNLEKNTDANVQHINKDLNFFMKDFLYFKNDILKDLKNLETKIDNQKKLNTDLKNKISIQGSKLSKITDTLKKKSEDNFSSLDYKLKFTSDDLKNAINRYDKIIYENLMFPGVLGRDSKFKDLRELLDYVLNNIKIFFVIIN